MDIVRARASLFFIIELLFNVHHLVVGLVISLVVRLVVGLVVSLVDRLVVGLVVSLVDRQVDLNVSLVDRLDGQLRLVIV